MGQVKTNLARAVLIVLCTSLGWVFQRENTERSHFLLFHCFLLMVTTQINGSIAHHGVEKKRFKMSQDVLPAPNQGETQAQNRGVVTQAM